MSQCVCSYSTLEEASEREKGISVVGEIEIQAKRRRWRSTTEGNPSRLNIETTLVESDD